jgi:hypothetical protein
MTELVHICYAETLMLAKLKVKCLLSQPKAHMAVCNMGCNSSLTMLLININKPGILVLYGQKVCTKLPQCHAPQCNTSILILRGTESKYQPRDWLS